MGVWTLMDSISPSQSGRMAGQSHIRVHLDRPGSHPGPGNPEPLSGPCLWGAKIRMDGLTHSIGEVTKEQLHWWHLWNAWEEPRGR